MEEIMEPQKRRSKLGLALDILKILEKRTKPTHLMYKANISHKLLNIYIDKLTEEGLMTCIVLKKKKSRYKRGRRGLIITEKGKELLESVRKIEALVKLMEWEVMGNRSVRKN